MTTLLHVRSIVIGSLLALLVVVGPANAVDGYYGFEGGEQAQVVYDFRHATPKTAEIFLGLIHSSLTDPALASREGAPKFTVVFMGPSLTLVTTPPADATSDEQGIYERIAKRISMMADDGIDFEVCMFAANLMGIAPETLHSDLRQIDNGFIASVGYQSAGYSMIPVF